MGDVVSIVLKRLGLGLITLFVISILISLASIVLLLIIQYNSIGKPIIILTTLTALFWAIWVRWRRFRIARIDPVLEDVEEGFDAVGDGIARRRGGLRRWLDSWKSK